MGNWKTCTIADLGMVVGGATPSTKEAENYDGGTIAWITPKDLAGYSERFISHGKRDITETGLHSCSAQMMPRHSVLFSSRAPIGYVAIAENELCTNQGFKSVVPNENTDYMFLYYLLLNNRQRIQHMGSGTTFKEVSGKTMRSIEVRVPESKEEQIRISSILATIDDKIEENERINKNLFQQAQSIYSAWFEQFLLYNGKMPSNWHIGTIRDIADITTNSFNPQKNPGVMLEHYSIPAFDEQHFPVFELSDNVKSNKYILTNNSVLASKLNPDTKRVWRPMCLSENAVCSTEFIVFESKDPEHKDFLFSIIDSQPFSDWMCAHTTGSTNSRQRTTPSTTLDFKIAVPPDDVVDEFCSTVAPMYDLISQNLLENQRFSSLRDQLLPKLMTGEIDVSNIDL